MQGKGTFVAKPKVAQLLELASYTQGMRAHGLHPQTKILDTSYIARRRRSCPPCWPSGRAAGCCASTGCGWPTASPCRRTPRTCPPGGSPGCAATWSGIASLYEALATAYGVQLAEAEETIETGLADPRDARLLGVDVGMPLLLLSRHAFDARRHAGRMGPVALPWRPLQAGDPAAPRHTHAEKRGVAHPPAQGSPREPRHPR